MTSKVSHQGTATTYDYQCNSCDAVLIDQDWGELSCEGWWLIAGSYDKELEEDDRHFCSIDCLFKAAEKMFYGC